MSEKDQRVPQIARGKRAGDARRWVDGPDDIVIDMSNIPPATKKQVSLGEQISLFRRSNKLHIETFAMLAGADPAEILGVENNPAVDPPLAVVQNLIVAFGTIEGASAKNILTKLRVIEAAEREKERDQTWVSTLKKVPFSKGIKLLRAADGLSQTDFAPKVGIDRNQLCDLEQDTNKPYFSTTNGIIRAAGLNPEGKAAQLLRLKGDEYQLPIMTTDELVSCSPGSLMRYLRILKGVVPASVAEVLGKSRGTIKDWELGRNNPRSIDMGAYLDWLGLPPESPLAEIVTYKLTRPDDPLPLDKLSLVASDKYLFENPSDQANDNPQISEKDKGILIQVEEAPTFGLGFRVARKENGFSQKRLVAAATDSVMPQRAMSAMERGEHYPKYETVVPVLRPLGYTVHHPVSVTLFDKLEQDTQRRKVYTKQK